MLGAVTAARAEDKLEDGSGSQVAFMMDKFEHIATKLVEDEFPDLTGEEKEAKIGEKAKEIQKDFMHWANRNSVNLGYDTTQEETYERLKQFAKYKGADGWGSALVKSTLEELRRGLRDAITNRLQEAQVLGALPGHGQINSDAVQQLMGRMVQSGAKHVQKAAAVGRKVGGDVMVNAAKGLGGEGSADAQREIGRALGPLD
jgi:hypothetical protein